MKTTRMASTLFLLSALGCAQCAVTVTGDPRPADLAGLAPAPFEPTASCAEVEARCTDAPQRFFRSSASGLTGLDGGRVEVAVRYLLSEGAGLNVPHGVALGRTDVRGGAFEVCVCVPRNANLYPQVAAVVFTPGSRAETGRDVARGFFSQRYAIVGAEDLSHSLREAPSPAMAEAALAAMSERVASATLLGLDGALEGSRVFGGVVSAERPIAATVAHGAVRGSSARLEWIMPGREWPSESVVFVIDGNGNGRCDESDVGASARPDAEGIVRVGALSRGAAVRPLCEALRMDLARDG